ncbi:Glucanase B [Ceratocystis lukuohia]|uniref:Glucanase B n=1 Tax=Ceratocystis lukuohia TaxID=2019550 RepID=A0ABR4MD71_9PEZI
MVTAQTLDITLRNDTASSNVFVTVTGRAMQRNMRPVFLSADGKTPFYPASPSAILQPLNHDVSIALGPPGSTRVVTVPRIAGGRIWFCKDASLTFLVNPGPAVVEPSMMNKTDPNYYLDWGFAEFTFNEHQLFVNVSYVDFVSIPVSLELENTAGKRMVVEGFPSDGLEQVCRELQKQEARDHAGWGKLVVQTQDGSKHLRALSPNSGCHLFPGLFRGYLEPYVDQVWEQYSSKDRTLVVNTQAAWGDVSGEMEHCHNKLLLSFGGFGKFEKPSTADIFSCSTGPFARTADYTEAKGAIGARLAAALNRTTLVENCQQPEGETESRYYQMERTNHYARICHEVSIRGRGYAFPYDDVSASKGMDQSGSLWDGSPKMLTLGIGGWRGSE